MRNSFGYNSVIVFGYNSVIVYGYNSVIVYECHSVIVYGCLLESNCLQFSAEGKKHLVKVKGLSRALSWLPRTPVHDAPAGDYIFETQHHHIVRYTLVLCKAQLSTPKYRLVP